MRVLITLLQLKLDKYEERGKLPRVKMNVKIPKTKYHSARIVTFVSVS